MKKDYSQITDNIVSLVGGKDNVATFAHCITRLRFNVRDKSKVNKDEITRLPNVIGSQWSGDQFQVIIGQEVGDVYNEIIKRTGLKAEKSIEENLDEKINGKKKFDIRNVFVKLSGCIIPLLPMLIAGGLLKAFILGLSTFGLISVESSTYVILNFASNAPMYILPVAIGYTGAKQFDANPSLGIALGAVLLHPTFTEMVSAGDVGTIFGLSIPANSYASSIFPMILTMFVTGYVERFFAKYSPKSIRSMVEPLCTFVIMLPLMLCFLAPLGSYISVYLGIGIKWLYDTIGPLGTALFAAFSPFLVMTGMHLCLDPYTADALATTGKEVFVGPAMAVRNFCQGMTCFPVAIKTKDPDLRATAISCGITAIFGGVTEPALFGINVRFKKPLYAAMIGGFFGGLYAGIMHCARFAYGGAGIFGLAVFMGENPMNLINEVIAIIIGCAVTFIVGMIIIKPEDIDGANK